MGLELELSELAALRPIRTAVSGATMTRRGDSGGIALMARQEGSEEVAADTGCVTPTARGAPAMQDGGKDGEADTGCVTPTSSASALRPATVCPPAPRKPRPAKRKRCGRPPSQRPLFFPVPHDLAAVFVPRAAASPPCPPAKKIRVHSVG